MTGRDWAGWMVRELLDSANADTSCLLWTSLADVLPLLAEAAPSRFLEAVRVVPRVVDHVEVRERPEDRGRLRLRADGEQGENEQGECKTFAEEFPAGSRQGLGDSLSLHFNRLLLIGRWADVDSRDE